MIELVQFWGSDQMVADAARVSTDRDREGRPIEGLIKYLARAGHASPFEHCGATFMVTAPLFVRDQWVRHRTQSYNALSLRYTRNSPEFYLPGSDRPLCNSGTPAHPKFDTAPTRAQHKSTIQTMQDAYDAAFDAYCALLEDGIAEEVARMVLPVGTKTRFYATANLRNWAAFVKERTAENAQWEIKKAAQELSHILAEKFPISWSALVPQPTTPTTPATPTTPTNPPQEAK